MIVEMYRHGMTSANERRAYIGSTDESLSAVGERALSCIDASERAVWVSPALRARQTASILFPQARHLVVEDFCEMNFGRFELYTADELADDPDYRAWVLGNCEGACPAGESRVVFQQRSTRAFCEVVDAGVRNGQKLVRIVCHAGTIMSVLDAFAQPHRGYFDWHVGFGSHVRLDLDDSFMRNRVLRVAQGGDDT